MKKKRVGSRGNMTDMTQGNPYRLIFLFSLPLLFGNVLQQLYNMVDSIVVGNVIGDKALAAVGTGFPIIFMMSSLFMGIGVGATVMISQFYGARDFKRVNETVGTIYTSMIVGIIPLSLIGIFASKPLLQLIQVPDDGTLSMAHTYMIIIFIGMIGSLGYNINAGILQGLGDSKTSLLFLAVATVINIVLDLLFAIPLKMGVAGVALATIIAQISSWVFGIQFINKQYDFIHIRLFPFFFDKQLFKEAIKLGIPSGIQQALFSVGTMVMQSLVNSYGFNFMAGFNGANKIDTFAFMPIQSFAAAITTYTGQNIGAGDHSRVYEGIRAGTVITVGSSVLIGAALYPISGFLMQMFSKSPDVIDAGISYLHCALPFYFLLAFMYIFNSTLRGTGETIVPMIASFVALWFARVPIAYFIAEHWGKNYLFLSYGFGWALGSLIAGIYFATGRWKRKSLVSHS